MNTPTPQSGFNLALGDQCSRTAYQWAKRTFANRTGKPGQPGLSVDGAFANLLDFHGAKIGISSDGIGTKIELAERTGCYDTLGYDLMAMVANDLIAGGFEPTNVSNILDVDVLDAAIVDDLMRGLHDAATEAGVAISGGEIAELGGRIAGYGDRMHCNWCATALGVLHETLSGPLDGRAIRPGDTVLALQSRGFRSNGFSLIRRTMQAHFGDAWHATRYDDAQTWGDALLTPSRIFAPAVCALFAAGVRVTGVAHITGGGLRDNLARVLKVEQLGADLPHLFAPLPVMQRLQTVGGISDETAYQYWNMGNGMLVIVTSTDADAALDLLAERGYAATAAGVITAEPTIRLNSEAAS